jgi:hypothetical protein
MCTDPGRCRVIDDVVGHMGRLLGDAHDLVTVDQHWRVEDGRGRLRAVASRLKDPR